MQSISLASISVVMAPFILIPNNLLLLKYALQRLVLDKSQKRTSDSINPEILKSALENELYGVVTSYNDYHS